MNVAAGAGPDPYNAQGKVYMAGPYHGAPLSLAIITPAAAGPFDLGTVLTRVALHIDPSTAQITAVSDPIPSILQGIPLDVRSAQVRLDKPNFTLNGTSCDPSQVTARRSPPSARPPRWRSASSSASAPASASNRPWRSPSRAAPCATATRP